MVDDDLVEGRSFGGTSPVVQELLVCLFTRVAPEHTGEFGELGIKLSVKRVDPWDRCQSDIKKIVVAQRRTDFYPPRQSGIQPGPAAARERTQKCQR